MSTTTSTNTAAGAKPESFGAAVGAAASGVVQNELTFFQKNPKAIAIGVAVTEAAIFLGLHFGFGIL